MNTEETIEPENAAVNMPYHIDVKIKKLNPSAVLPTRGSDLAAGYDLYSNERVTIWPNETKIVSTGIAVEMPPWVFGAVYPRSGLAIKYGVDLANCVAVFDADYRGDWRIALHNNTNSPFAVEHGDRIAQVIFQPYLVANISEVNELSETERGSGGLGSTGR